MNKPQLVMQDFGGEHGLDLKKTTARLIRGASWKPQRIVVVIPSADLIPAKVALSHWNLAFPPNNGVVRLLALGQEVGEAYTNAIESVLAHSDLSQWEFILTLEHDNMPPGDGVVKLIEQMEAHPEYACIGGLYFCKGPGGCAHIWGDPKDPQINFRPQPPDPEGGLVECVGQSMGFHLWRMSLFRDTRLRKPWFKTLNGSAGTGIGTQDLYAWSDFRKYGYRCAVDCSIKVGHYDYKGDFGQPDYVW
jgi:hypothetical protein